jgi:ABC-type transporter Mla MlaB component
MLRIAIEGHGTAAQMLRLSGSISGVWVGELRRCCESCLAQGYRLVLDLQDVRYADYAGLELLSELKARDISVAQWTPLVSELLTAHEGQVGKKRAGNVA